jgi:hypothetical protein
MTLFCFVAVGCQYIPPKAIADALIKALCVNRRLSQDDDNSPGKGQRVYGNGRGRVRAALSCESRCRLGQRPPGHDTRVADALRLGANIEWLRLLVGL